MNDFAMAFVVSFVACLVIVRFSGRHGLMSFDYELDGVQKMHAHAVPRIGGLAIALGVGMPTLAGIAPEPLAWLLACSAPAFIAGLVEDLTKQVSPRARLLGAMGAALLCCFVSKTVITRVDVSLVDTGLSFVPLAVGLTVVAVAGLANAINIIDGFNGLASVVGILMLASIGFIGHQVGDPLLTNAALIMIGAIGGFVIWNYPAGLIFLGDGGAYFVGFMIAELLVLLVARHPEVSAWYAMLVTIYPTFETLFSIYRRGVVRGRPVSEPDGIHLHTLIYKRALCRGQEPNDMRERIRRNSRTSPYLWLLSLGGIVPATLFWSDRAVLGAFVLLFVVVYVWLYVSIARFQTPRWLFARSSRVTVVAPKD